MGGEFLAGAGALLLGLGAGLGRLLPFLLTAIRAPAQLPEPAPSSPGATTTQPMSAPGPTREQLMASLMAEFREVKETLRRMEAGQADLLEVSRHTNSEILAVGAVVGAMREQTQELARTNQTLGHLGAKLEVVVDLWTHQARAAAGA